MDRVHKLPFILGSIMSIVIGLISYYSNVEITETYIRMFLALIVFFAIGSFAKNVILSLKKEVEDKIEEEELERLQLEAEEKLSNNKGEELLGNNIDLKTVEDKEEFMTESLTKAISSQLDED